MGGNVKKGGDGAKGKGKKGGLAKITKKEQEEYISANLT